MMTSFLYRDKPSVRERLVTAAEALARVQEPALAPQVFQAVRRWRTGQVNEAFNLLVGHLAERTGALATAATAERLQLGRLVGNNHRKRPAVTPDLEEPLQDVVVAAHHVGVVVQHHVFPVLAAAGAVDDSQRRELPANLFRRPRP